MDGDLYEKLHQIDSMLTQFKNEQVINQPVVDIIDISKVNQDMLSSEYQKYLSSGLHLFTVYDQMNERSQLWVLKDWMNTMIEGYIKSVDTTNLARVHHSLLLISFAMSIITTQIRK